MQPKSSWIAPVLGGVDSKQPRGTYRYRYPEKRLEKTREVMRREKLRAAS
jgi:hypothetical protein